MPRVSSLSRILNNPNGEWDEIDLRGKNLGSEDVPKLAGWLENHRDVRILNLESNGIDSNVAIVLSQALEKHTRLRELNLGNNQIAMRGIKSIECILEKHSSLKRLYLNDNWLDDNSTILSQSSEKDSKKHSQSSEEDSKKHSSLEILDLSNNRIGAKVIEDLFNSLASNSNLCILNLGNNLIGNDGATPLLENIKNHPKLQELVLSNNKINGDKAFQLAEHIGVMSRLQILNLDGNQIGAKGAGVLCGALKKLQVLSLCDNQIGDEGLKALMPGLKGCTDLKVLNLACNQISSKGLNELVELLKDICDSRSIFKNGLSPIALEILNLSGNQIDSEGAKTLSEVLKQYTKLKELDLGSNSIGDEGAIAVADLLSSYNKASWPSLKLSSPSLKILKLHDNRIGEKGSNALVKELEKFKLDILNLSNNAINADNIEKIEGLFKGNKSNLILGNQTPKIAIFPVEYSEGLEKNEINAIKNLIENEIKLSQTHRQTACKLLQNATGITNEEKENILEIIQDDTILTKKDVDNIRKEIGNCSDTDIKVREHINNKTENSAHHRQAIRELLQNATGITTEEKENILELIQDNTILTKKDVDDISEEIKISHCKTAKRIKEHISNKIRDTAKYIVNSEKEIRDCRANAVNEIRNLIRDKNLITVFKDLDCKKSKSLFVESDIIRINSLIAENKLTLNKFEEINNDLFKLQNLIDEGTHLVNQNSNKAIFLFGKTGVGKSTLANLLLERELEAVKRNGGLKLDTVDSTDIKISHCSNSETQLPNSGRLGNTVVLDCPGFQDSNYIKRIANSYYIDKLCRMHEQNKFLLVTSFLNLGNRGDGLVGPVKEFTNMFKDISQIKDFASLVVTCVPAGGKENIIQGIDNALLDATNLSNNEQEMLRCFKNSLSLFYAPEKEGLLDRKDIFSSNGCEEYCTDSDIRLSVNVEKDQEAKKRDLAKKMLNISSDNLNQVTHVIKKTIKNPFECVGNKNNIFIRNHHFIKEWTQGVAGYGGDKVDLFDLFADQQTRDGHFSNLDLLNNLSKTLQGDINSYEDFFKKITGAIRQFGCYAKGKDVKFFQEKYCKILQDYIRYSQEQFGYVEFFSNMLGSSLERSDKLKTIISECAKANELNLKEAVISMVLEQGQDAAYYKKALEYLSFYNELECKINTANAYIELGNIYLGKDNEKAIDFYVGAIKAHAKNPEAYKKLGEIFCEQGCYKKAVQCYKAINHYLGVIDSFENWIINHDKWIMNKKRDIPVLDVLIEKGDYYKSIGLYEDAKKAYMRVFSLTNDKMTLKKLSYKIASILENMTNTADNFNRMADEENFYNFNELDIDSIELSGDG